MNAYLENLFSLEGKVALVTGASRGLGKAMAIALAKAGADLIITATNEDNLSETKAAIRQIGRKVIAIGCDQSQPEQIDNVFAKIQQHYDRLDILINNAGTIHRAPAHKTLDADWDRVINTNLNGVFHFAEAQAQ